jgi:RNA polymerase sigma-70 factor (sigma-E family)
VTAFVQGEATMADEFDEWVAARGPGLLRLAYVLTGNRADAEDAVQDALSRALPRWEHIRNVGDPDAYVRRMVANAHTSWWRRFRKRETPVAEAFTPGVHDGPGNDDRDRVWRACLALPEGQRVAVVLRYYEQLEYAEIAALTGLAEGSVRARVSRGLAALRTSLGEEDNHD